MKYRCYEISLANGVRCEPRENTRFCCDDDWYRVQESTTSLVGERRPERLGIRGMSCSRSLGGMAELVGQRMIACRERLAKAAPARITGAGTLSSNWNERSWTPMR